MGGAHAVAALAYGTESDRRASTSSPARATSTCRRPSAWSRATSASTASPGPSDVLVRRRRGRRPRARRARPARPGRARRGHDRRARRQRRRGAARRGRRASGRRAGHAARPRRSSTRPTSTAALAFAEAFAPEHLELVGRRAPRRWPPRVRSRRLRVRRGARARTAFGDYVAGSNHTLPTGGAARFASRAVAAPLPPAHDRGPDRRRRRGAGAAPARRSRGPRASPCTRRRWRLRENRTADEPHAPRSAAQTKETDVAPGRSASTGTGAGTRSTGVGFLDHMLDLLARHGRLDLDVAATGDLQTGAHHTVEDTGIVLGQALDQALGDRRGITRYGHAVVPMDEARAACAIDISGRPVLPLRAPTLPPGATGGFDHELAEEFFRAVAQQRAADAAPDRRGGHERPPHDRGRVQGLRPRAARGRRDRPDRDRRALDEGRR